jgi:hypothetical protein
MPPSSQSGASRRKKTAHADVDADQRKAPLHRRQHDVVDAQNARTLRVDDLPIQQVAVCEQLAVAALEFDRRRVRTHRCARGLEIGDIRERHEVLALARANDDAADRRIACRLDRDDDVAQTTDGRTGAVHDRRVAQARNVDAVARAGLEPARLRLPADLGLHRRLPFGARCNAPCAGRRSRRPSETTAVGRRAGHSPHGE